MSRVDDALFDLSRKVRVFHADAKESIFLDVRVERMFNDLIIVSLLL